MSDDKDKFEFDVSDYVFMRGFVHEFVIVQMLTQLVRNGQTPEETKDNLLKLRQGAREFTEFLSGNDTPRDAAWRSEMLKTFNMIYGAASPIPLDDDVGR